jgi:hypothetical protein
LGIEAISSRPLALLSRAAAGGGGVMAEGVIVDFLKKTELRIQTGNVTNQVRQGRLLKERGSS